MIENSFLYLTFTWKGEAGKTRERESAGGKSLFSHWQVLCSKTVPMNPACVIGFKEEKEQFVLCVLCKNTLDRVLLAADYNLYPRVSVEENKKTSVKPTIVLL